jgi:hypothetical protein
LNRLIALARSTGGDAPFPSAVDIEDIPGSRVRNQTLIDAPAHGPLLVN